MRDKLFLDTNVFVYAYSKTAQEKRRIALEILSSERIVLSTQVINEFIWLCTENLKYNVKNYKS